MPALQDGEVAKDDVSAVLERDGFIADTRLLRRVDRIIAARHAIRAEAKTLPVDKTCARDREIMEVLAPEQRVTPVIVSVVLIGVPCAVGLGRVVGSAVVAGLLPGRWGIGRQDRRALREKEVHAALQMDGEAKICAGRKEDGTSTSCGRRSDRPVDRWRIERFAVARCTVRAHIKQHRSPGHGRTGFLCESGYGAAALRRPRLENLRSSRRAVLMMSIGQPC